MGFSFENYERNQNLLDNGQKSGIKFTKTGTTIVGILFKDGIILGADTRASAGTFIADKNSLKIEKLSDFMYCGGAGTAADAMSVKKMIRSQLELHRLLMGGKPVRVCAAVQMLKEHLFKYQGYVSAALIVGGIDETGNHLYSISPHGSYDKLQYTAMGSGCLAALAHLESKWKPDIGLDDGKKLVRDAIAAGIFNDLGSGNNIDLCVITKDYKVDYLRSYELGDVQIPKQQNYTFKPKSCAIISRTVIPIKDTNTIKRQLGQESREEEAMEIL